MESSVPNNRAVDVYSVPLQFLLMFAIACMLLRLSSQHDASAQLQTLWDTRLQR